VPDWTKKPSLVHNSYTESHSAVRERVPPIGRCNAIIRRKRTDHRGRGSAVGGLQVHPKVLLSIWVGNWSAILFDVASVEFTLPNPEAKLQQEFNDTECGRIRMKAMAQIAWSTHRQPGSALCARVAGAALDAR
jgi:hypothetical protein